jgi:hypothetical protein
MRFLTRRRHRRGSRLRRTFRRKTRGGVKLSSFFGSRKRSLRSPSKESLLSNSESRNSEDYQNPIQDPEPIEYSDLEIGKTYYKMFYKGNQKIIQEDTRYSLLGEYGGKVVNGVKKDLKTLFFDVKKPDGKIIEQNAIIVKNPSEEGYVKIIPQESLPKGAIIEENRK